jgi:hypothetical protein
MADHESTKKLTRDNVNPIKGVNQNNVVGGLSIPNFLFFNRVCVKLHRRPLNALALVTRRNPSSIKCVCVATIKTTPMKIRNITPIRRNENFSRPKRNANPRTNINDDDLHIAS